MRTVFMSSHKVILEREYEGGFSIYCPALPGCASQGETEQEALENIREAIACFLEACDKERRPFPPVEEIR